MSDMTTTEAARAFDRLDELIEDGEMKGRPCIMVEHEYAQEILEAFGVVWVVLEEARDLVNLHSKRIEALETTKAELHERFGVDDPGDITPRGLDADLKLRRGRGA